MNAQKRSAAEPMVTAIAVGSLTLVQAPAVVGNGIVARAATLAPLLWVIVSRSRGHRRPARTQVVWKFGAALFFMAVLAVTLFRGVEQGVYDRSSLTVLLEVATPGVVLLFGYALIVGAPDAAARARRAAWLALAPAAAVAFNLLIENVPLPLITPPDATSMATGSRAILLELFGIHTSRATLPLAGGVNASGALSAAGFAAALVLAWWNHPVRRLVTVPAAGVCLYATLLADSRAALFIAVGATLVLILLPGMRRRSHVAAALVLAPGLALTVIGMLASSGFTALSRGSDDLATGNTRTYIWDAAWGSIQDFDLFHLLFGYGANGQVTSGASLHYAYMFLGQPSDPFMFTVHNLPLQTVLDAGLVGLAAIAALLVATVAGLRGTGEEIGASVSALIAMAIVLILNGATEALPSYIFPATLMPLLLVTGVALGLDATRAPAPGRSYGLTPRRALRRRRVTWAPGPR